MNPLLKHFLAGMLHPGSTQGDDESAGPAVQLLGVVLAASWFLPASMYSRYMVLQGLADGRLYRIAYASDALLIAVIVALAVAFATVMLWPAMFLSRIEYLVLTPLPVSKPRLIVLKGAAAICFMTGFIVALTSCACVLIPGLASGVWEPRGLGVRILGYVVMLYGTGVFTFLWLLVLQGFSAACLPNQMAGRLMFPARSLVLLAVVCAIPLIQYFPSQYAVAAHPAWLLRVPPAWFWGWGEWVAGDRSPFVEVLRKRALLALPLSIGLAFVTYGLAYLRSESLLCEQRSRKRGRGRLFEGMWPHSASAGTLGFVVRTLVRSRPHTTSLLLSCGFGFALMAESFVYLYFRGALHVQSSDFRQAILAIPNTLSFFAALAMVRSFRIVSELPANWTFRFLENPSRRTEQLNVAYWTVFLAGFMWLILCVPAVWWVLRGQAWESIWFGLLNLAIYCEYLLRDWNGIPFTREGTGDSANLIKRAVRRMAEFAVYCGIMPPIFWGALQHPGFALFLSAAMAAVLVDLHRRRMKEWGKAPLRFEEPVAPVVEPLRILSA